jgi:diguanylate cyclase (GGDEF)-like protein
MTLESLTTKQVIVRIVTIISSAEFLVMLLLGIIPLEVSTYSEAVLDLALLALLSTPLIYIWVINPFVTARDEALDQINHLAHTDPLTQLPNRRFLSIHLEKFIAGTIRHKLRGAVLLMDLDGFKVVNDTYGHHAGDEVLVEIAKRLRSNTRSEDVAGRLGGDEFFILIQHLDADEQIARDSELEVAEKLINVVNKPIDFNGTMLNVSASIGIRLLGFEELDTKTVIREADIAMYRAKQAGRGCAVFFEK